MPKDVQKELTGAFDSNTLSDAARKWLEERIAEQVDILLTFSCFSVF